MDYSTIRTLVHFLFLGIEHLFEEVYQSRRSFDSHDRREGMITLGNSLHLGCNRLHWRKTIRLPLDKRVTRKEPYRMREALGLDREIEMVVPCHNHHVVRVAGLEGKGSPVNQYVDRCDSIG